MLGRMALVVPRMLGGSHRAHTPTPGSGKRVATTGERMYVHMCASSDSFSARGGAQSVTTERGESAWNQSVGVFLRITGEAALSICISLSIHPTHVRLH